MIFTRFYMIKKNILLTHKLHDTQISVSTQFYWDTAEFIVYVWVIVYGCVHPAKADLSG